MKLMRGNKQTADNKYMLYKKCFTISQTNYSRRDKITNQKEIT